MYHTIHTIGIGDYFFLLISERYKTEASFVKYYEIMTLIHKAFDWRFPKLVHFKAELDETSVHLDNNDDKLIDVNSLVTNNHFNLVLTLARHVLSFDEYKVQCCIINLQLICPLDNKFWPLRLHRLVNVNFKQKVAQFLLILIRKNVKLFIKKRDSLDV